MLRVILAHFKNLVEFRPLALVLARNTAKLARLLAKTESAWPNFVKFQMEAKFTFNMKPDQFLSFLDLCGPSQAQPQGQKMIPWDCQKLMLKHINMCFICQNFSSNGQTGKKFDVFPSMAFKRTALQPLNVVKPFFDTLLL